MSLRHACLPLLIAAALPLAAHAAPRGLEPRDLATLERYASPQLTPDGGTVLFTRRTVDFDGNRSSTALWAQDTREGAKPRRITPDGWNINSPELSADGRTAYFLSAKSGSMQLYAVPVAGGKPRQLTALPLDVGSYSVAPDGRRVALSLEVFPECGAEIACSVQRNEARSKDKRSGRVFDRMFVRHWDAWNEGRLNRLFVADLGTKPAADAKLVGGAIVADVPSRPFGDATEYAWSPDGSSIAFSARNADRVEPWSTNFDIYLAPADGSGEPRNLTQGNPAWDTVGQFSPDGRRLYYRAMKRPGFEADRFALIELELATGVRREIAPQWDRSADSVHLSDDGRTIYTTAQDMGQHPLFAIDVASGVATRVVGDGSVSAVDVENGRLAFARNTLHSGDQIFVGGIGGQPVRAVTPSAAQMLPHVRFGDFEQFSFKGWNGDTVHGYVVKPWNYVEGRKYPVAFLIHGGPQGSFGNGWSYRWNPQTYAGQGYAVVMIDFHGSTGYGQAFTDAISQHWGDRPLEDLQKGWAAAQKQYPFLDGERACALGASYGGYMVNWIAGRWNAPWKCLVSHAGVFDQRMMGYSTEELWFTEWENGGTPFEVPQNYERFNPVNHVDQWRVPMLVIHGQLDYRIPVEQGIAAFHALQRRNVPSKFLYFPDENHWILKPQNSVQWHETVNGWLRQHIGQ